MDNVFRKDIFANTQQGGRKKNNEPGILDLSTLVFIFSCHLLLQPNKLRPKNMLMGENHCMVFIPSLILLI